MTVNEHVNAIYSSVPNMSEKDLKDLEKSLEIVLSDVRSQLNTQTHLQLHHSAPTEGK